IVCCSYLLNSLRAFGPFAAAMEFFEELVSTCGAGFKPKLQLESLLGLYHRDGAGSAREFFRYLCREFTIPRYGKESGREKEEFTAHKDALKDARDKVSKWFDFKSEYAENISEFEYRFYSSFLEIYRRSKIEYEKRKKAENMLDFQDVADLIASDADTLRSAGARYSHVLIDEFQDTNRLQVGIVKAMRPGPKLTIVGDAMQSIYRFRNAQCALFGELSAEFESGGGKIVRMDDNFRSNRDVLAFVNDFFEYLSGARTAEDEKLSDIGYGPLKSSAPPECPGPCIEVGLFEDTPPAQAAPAGNAVNGSPENISGFKSSSGKENKSESAGGNESRNGADEEDAAPAGQYEFIARRILKLIKDGDVSDPGEIMILMSRMTHVEELETELKKYGVGYYLHKSRKFYSRNEIYDILNLVRFIASPDEDLGLAGLLRSPLFAVADGFVFDIVSSYREALRAAGDKSNGSIFEALKLFTAGKITAPSIELRPAEKKRICFIYKALS
ncbi:MAG TPA: UvrD-helicase domain-containing protein, partial [Candidatus Wallbacteria bacterium]|nr:UvrD-helicase domain-containing protein [Candidatus Wallbacteria bacterium]